ncbi:hypothetical protein SDJN03_09619, partial [Cucurbita argyrosperma subsp. sororia]
MAHCTKMDIKWSGNTMEGSEVLKTMECLRRRLLAERQASLLAKEEAELMGKRTKRIQMLEALPARVSQIQKFAPTKEKIENSGDEFNSVDDSLALVAVNSPEEAETGEMMLVIGERVIEVLNDLKQARERIQRSMKICELNMMKVSPV